MARSETSHTLLSVLPLPFVCLELSRFSSNFDRPRRAGNVAKVLSQLPENRFGKNLVTRWIKE